MRGAVGDPTAQWDRPGPHSAAVGFPRSHNDAGRATCKSLSGTTVSVHKFECEQGGRRPAAPLGSAADH